MPIMMLIVEILLIIMGIRWKTWKQTENCREKQKIPAANGKLAAGKLKTFWKQQKKVEIFAEKLQNRAAGEGKLAPKRPTKSPTALKRLDISIKRTLKIGHRLCWFCAMQQRKKPVTFFMSQAFGALEGTRTPGLLIRSQTLYPAELPAHLIQFTGGWRNA